MTSATVIESTIVLALLLALALFASLHRHAAAGAAPVPNARTAPELPRLRLGQYAVAPDRQWMLVKPGS